MLRRIAFNFYGGTRSVSASPKYRLFCARSGKIRTTNQNNKLPGGYSFRSFSIWRGLCTSTSASNRTNNLPSLEEFQSYNTDQLCKFLARYTDATDSPSSTSAHDNHSATTAASARVFNDQTLTALRGQLVDGAALFHYPSARSIQCSGVQHKQAQRLFEFIQQLKTSK